MLNKCCQVQQQHMSPKNSSSTATTKLHAVKITSPIKGQQLPIGNSLIVTGTSSDNAISNCQVSVIANGIKPYQPATASGPGGANDYSKWSFTLAPKYIAIKDGQNKITSKITCSDKPTVGSYYSVNVTGLSAVKQVRHQHYHQLRHHQKQQQLMTLLHHNHHHHHQNQHYHQLRHHQKQRQQQLMTLLHHNHHHHHHHQNQHYHQQQQVITLLLLQVTTAKDNSIKITSPTKGQQLPVNSSLIVTGASSDNAISNCQVSVIANGIKPYQPATASGPGGANDYSKWSIILGPKYTAIKEGENKISSTTFVLVILVCLRLIL